MKFEGLKCRVERAEALVEGRIAQVQAHRNRLRLEVRQAITPGRILLAGLLGGFLVARARPLGTLRGVSATRWLKLATSVSSLLASLKAAHAAESAETAAKEAEHAAESAEATVEDVVADADLATTVDHGHAPAAATGTGRAVSDGRRRPDTQWDREPRPAEAATEVSER